MTGEPDVFDYYSDSESEAFSKTNAKQALLMLILLTLATAAVSIQAHWLDNHTFYRSAEAADIEGYLLSLTGRLLIVLIPCAYILAIVTLANRTVIACSILSLVVNALALVAAVPLAVYVSRGHEWIVMFPLPPALFALSVAAASADLRNKIKSAHELF